MYVLSGQSLSHSLRNACDSAKRRLWIAAPYVGAWEEVRRIIGRNWWDNTTIQVRLLTDPQEEGLNGATVQRLAQRGDVHELRGLHAKLYIIDDSVLLTSANLTGTAFSRRYEMGTWLKGPTALKAIELYDNWWDNPSKRLNLESLKQVIKRQRRDAGEDGRKALTVLNSLPNDTGDFGGHTLVNIFLDYPAFHDDYDIFAEDYVAVQRIWPTVPLYFETDGFLRYLFSYHPKHPSKRFEEQPPRTLSSVERRAEIRRLAKSFKIWAHSEHKDGRRRVAYSKFVHTLLSRTNIRTLSKAQIRKVAEGLNCMNDTRLRNRFLDSPRNSAANVRRAWGALLYSTEPLTERMSICAATLFGFKRSGVQELLGFFAPRKYPLRNATVNAGLRFFGFDVTAH